jgi:hypothetical protein
MDATKLIMFLHRRINEELDPSGTCDYSMGLLDAFQEVEQWLMEHLDG